MYIDFCERCGQTEKPVKFFFLREWFPPWRIEFQWKRESEQPPPALKEDCLELCADCEQAVRDELRANKKFKATVAQAPFPPPPPVPEPDTFRKGG